jgi:zinc transport system ATP-binding protein
LQENELIRLSGVTMQRDVRTVLHDVNLTISRGDFLAITGPNGGGKTTLLRIILRLLQPTAGCVSYCSDDIRIGYLPQKNQIDSHFPVEVVEVVEFGLLSDRSLSRSERAKRVAEVLELVGLTPFARKPIGTLSGGQLQRALLARAIVNRPEILVLDEPLSYVDKQFEQRIYQIVAELSHNTTIVLVSHEMSTIASMANRHLIVDGAIHECCCEHHFARIAHCDDNVL